jgi:hypothetical protein
MKKVIKPEDFPIEMNEENLNTLAEMSTQKIISDEWREIVFNILSDEEIILVNNKVSEIQRQNEKQRWESLTHEEQEEEKRSIERSLKEGPEVFRGNILQQEWDSIDIARIEKEKKKKEGQDESLE